MCFEALLMGKPYGDFERPVPGLSPAQPFLSKRSCSPQVCSFPLRFVAALHSTDPAEPPNATQLTEHTVSCCSHRRVRALVTLAFTVCSVSWVASGCSARSVFMAVADLRSVNWTAESTGVNCLLVQ